MEPDDIEGALDIADLAALDRDPVDNEVGGHEWVDAQKMPEPNPVKRDQARGKRAAADIEDAIVGATHAPSLEVRSHLLVIARAARQRARDASGEPRLLPEVGADGDSANRGGHAWEPAVPRLCVPRERVVHGGIVTREVGGHR